MIAFISLLVLRQIAMKAVGIFAYQPGSEAALQTHEQSLYNVIVKLLEAS